MIVTLVCTGNIIKSATIQVDPSPVGGIPTSYMINATSGTASYAVNVSALPSGSLVAYTIPNANISVIKPGDYSITVTAINCAGRQTTLQIVKCMGLCTIVYLHTIPMFS